MNRYKIHRPAIVQGQKWREKETGEIVEIYQKSFAKFWEILTPHFRTLVSEFDLKQEYEMVYE